jgi:MFS family permease
VIRRLVPSAYRPVLSHPVFRPLTVGFAVSYLGDGMSFLAVPWLAIELAPQASAGLWVGGAVAAYTLPGVVGAVAFGRWLRRVPARRLLLADNVLRAVFLGAIPVAWLAGVLTLPLYVALLGVSSLLHAWGSAGQYTLLAELLPDEQRLAANTLVGSLTFAGTIAGPAVAGLLVTQVSAAYVLGLDALSYLFLAVVVARLRLPVSGRVAPVDRAATRGGLGLLRSHRELLGLLTLTWFFNLLYGPVEVALPLHVTDDLHAPSTLLGLYWTLFGVGAVLGGLAVGGLRTAALVARDRRHRDRLGSRAAAVRLPPADRRHRGVLHAGRRDLRAVRRTLGDADAGEVAPAVPGRHARRPECGAAHRLPARDRARWTAHLDVRPSRDPRRLRGGHRPARRHRGCPAAGPTHECTGQESRSIGRSAAPSVITTTSDRQPQE